MEMENMENFTYDNDGNYTDLEPLYSLKDNVSVKANSVQSVFLMLKIFKVLPALHSHFLFIQSL